LSKMSDYTPNL